MLCGRSPLCGPPQTVSSLSCVPFSSREQLMVITLLCEHTCHIYRISNTSQFSYQRLTRIVLVTTDPIIAVSLRCLSDGIFPARKPDLHQDKRSLCLVVRVASLSKVLYFFPFYFVSGGRFLMCFSPLLQSSKFRTI